MSIQKSFDEPDLFIVSTLRGIKFVNLQKLTAFRFKMTEVEEFYLEGKPVM